MSGPLTFDLAVLGKSTFAILQIRDNHTVILKPQPITIPDFKNLFFYNNNFCITSVSLDSLANVSFAGQSVQLPVDCGYNVPADEQFDLYNCIFQYALSDLNLCADSISPIAQIELRKELTNLTLKSLNIINSTRYDILVSNIVVDNIFVISCVFTNKNICVKPVIIKFQYTLTAK